MTDSHNTNTDRRWVMTEEGGIEFLPFDIDDYESSESIPIDLDDELLQQIGIDLDTDEGRDKASMIIREAIQIQLDKVDEAKQAFDEWASRYDHDSNEWEDMGRDEIFLAGRLYERKSAEE